MPHTMPDLGTPAVSLEPPGLAAGQDPASRSWPTAAEVAETMRWMARDVERDAPFDAVDRFRTIQPGHGVAAAHPNHPDVHAFWATVRSYASPAWLRRVLRPEAWPRSLAYVHTFWTPFLARLRAGGPDELRQLLDHPLPSVRVRTIQVHGLARRSAWHPAQLDVGDPAAGGRRRGVARPVLRLHHLDPLVLRLAMQRESDAGVLEAYTAGLPRSVLDVGQLLDRLAPTDVGQYEYTTEADGLVITLPEEPMDVRPAGAGGTVRAGTLLLALLDRADLTEGELETIFRLGGPNPAPALAHYGQRLSHGAVTSLLRPGALTDAGRLSLISHAHATGVLDDAQAAALAEPLLPLVLRRPVPEGGVQGGAPDPLSGVPPIPWWPSDLLEHPGVLHALRPSAVSELLHGAPRARRLALLGTLAQHAATPRPGPTRRPRTAG